MFVLGQVAEVLLFSDDGVSGSGSGPGGLRMSICQWPNDPSKVIVYGCNASDSVSADGIDVSGAPFSSPSSNSGKDGFFSQLQCRSKVSLIWFCLLT